MMPIVRLTFLLWLGILPKVALALPDLVIQSFTVNPTSGPVGSNVTVSFTVRNQGNAAANQSTTNVRIASSSSSVTQTDPLLIGISTPSIAAGGTFNVNQQVTIPSGRPAGTNFIWVIADANSTAGQGTANEANDRVNTPFTVTTSPTPLISSVNPNPVEGSNGPQPFTIGGSNFISGGTVTLRDLNTGEVFPNRPISFLSSTQIVINPNFTVASHLWDVQVINPGGVASNRFQFNVVSGLRPIDWRENLRI